MTAKRFFFISDDLGDLETLERELERRDVVTPQIHVLTLDESDADQHRHLNQVASFSRHDIVRSTLMGAAVGGVAAFLALVVAYLAGWTESPAGWIPVIFLALILLGFFTWEGGLRGIESPNEQFAGFRRALEAGRHVFFVDLPRHQEQVLEEVLPNHPGVERAGTGRATPHQLVMWQHRVGRFFVRTFP